MRSLAQTGKFIRKLTMTQGEFLHPQTLNPWSKNCPNLESLTLLACQNVSDEMFVGEVPELERLPFRNLKELHLEGQLPVTLARYLVNKSPVFTRSTVELQSQLTRNLVP